MAIWEDFEIKCTKYLNERFGAYARFIHQGGSDSTIPDILVQTNSGKSFYIDVKYCPAQCGQFVLLPNIETCSFEYSRKNVNRINANAERIMNHMNGKFDEYREAGTAGKEIEMINDSTIFSDWIIQTYEEKGAEFFITNNFTILPVARLQDYFEVTAKYRIKRSGSSSVGKSRLSSVLNHIVSHGYALTDSRADGDKLFIKSNQNLHNTRFTLQKYEYMFSQRGEEFEVRKLSNTYNANVIFSIRQKGRNAGISDEVFINYLK